MEINKMIKVITLLADYGRVVNETAPLSTLAGASEAANTRQDESVSPNRIITEFPNGE